MKDKKALRSIRDHLEDTLHYSEAAVESIMDNVEQMDEETFQALMTWRRDGVFTGEPVEGVTAGDLAERLEMEPVCAFICYAWLKTRPEEAKYALTHPWHGLEIDSELKRRLMGALSHE